MITERRSKGQRQHSPTTQKTVEPSNLLHLPAPASLLPCFHVYHRDDSDDDKYYYKKDNNDWSLTGCAVGVQLRLTEAGVTSQHKSGNYTSQHDRRPDTRHLSPLLGRTVYVRICKDGVEAFSNMACITVSLHTRL